MINSFLLNVFLSVVYCALLGRVTFLDFVSGFAIGFVIISLINRVTGNNQYLGRIWSVLRFGTYFLAILVKANAQVAWEVITPGLAFRPRVVRYPVPELDDVQITVLANAITLTPGTLSADIDEASRTLYVHCMWGGDRDEAIADLDNLRDRLLREVFDEPA
ncbi:MAG: Na+/H+ antiporter subunit E [Planctomycetota bacterium]